jgi:hypothetical protein
VKCVIEPIRPEVRLDGLEQYKRAYLHVWNYRGESRRCVADRWSEFLLKNDFLDAFVIRRS